jgi:hypothetical protein
MIIHCSKDFTKRYKCRLSAFEGGAAQSGKMTSWSAHFFRIHSTPLVLLMHDASLWPILIEVKGVTKLEDLLPLFLERVMDLFRAHEHVFDEKNQAIIFLPRSNRSLIGSMNDAIKTLEFHSQDIRSRGEVVNWLGFEAYITKTPFSAIDYQSPLQRLRELLSS